MAEEEPAKMEEEERAPAKEVEPKAEAGDGADGMEAGEVPDGSKGTESKSGNAEELSRARGREGEESREGGADAARGREGERDRGDRGERIGRDMFAGRDGRSDFDRGGRDFRGGGRGGGPEWRGGGRGRGMMDGGDRGRGFRGGGRGYGSLAMGPGREELMELQIDREKVCPMLLRIFCKFNDFHEDTEFSWEKQPLDDEVRVHTWRDATLGELTELLAQVHREVRQTGTRCSFKVVFPDASGKFASHQLGATATGRRLPDDATRKTLAQIRFQVGDFLAVAIYPARSGYNKAMEKVADEGAKEEEPEEGKRRREREPGEDEDEEKEEKEKEEGAEQKEEEKVEEGVKVEGVKVEGD